MAGTSAFKTLALIGETCLAIWVAYVFYRWDFNHTPAGFMNFNPFSGPFETVVMPWLLALIPIPAGLFVLHIFRTRRHPRIARTA
jgi:hypothetical protein